MKTLITLVFLFFAVCSFGQINDENAFFDGTYSKDYIKRHGIRTVARTSYMETNHLTRTVYYFDKNGLIERQSIVDSNGKEQTRFVFKFNKFGDLSQRITLPYDDYRADTFIIQRKYNSKKIVKGSSTYSPLTAQYFYNKKGDRIRTINPYNNGQVKLSRRIVDFEYDNRSRLVHVTDRVCSGSSDNVEQWMSDRTITYSIDKMQKIIEKIPNGEFPTNKGNVEYSYDSLGNVISILSDAVVSRYFSYDNKGLLKSKREKFPEGFDTLSGAKITDEYTYTFQK